MNPQIHRHYWRYYLPLVLEATKEISSSSQALWSLIHRHLPLLVSSLMVELQSSVHPRLYRHYWRLCHLHRAFATWPSKHSIKLPLQLDSDERYYQSLAAIDWKPTQCDQTHWALILVTFVGLKQLDYPSIVKLSLLLDFGERHYQSLATLDRKPTQRHQTHWVAGFSGDVPPLHSMTDNQHKVI